MTVKQLIEELQQLDPETEIYTSITDPTDYVLTLPLEEDNLELSEELYGSNVMEDFEDEFDDDDGEYKGKPVLIITLEV
jgi:hypothetical protein